MGLLNHGSSVKQEGDPKYVMGSDSTARVNAAVEIVEQLICPKTGRVFHVIDWGSSVNLEDAVSVTVKAIVEMPSEGKEDGK